MSDRFLQNGRVLMLLVFFSALLVGFSGAMMPGSLLAYTIRKSLSAGPQAGFIIVAGHAALEMALIVLIMMGFDVVLQSAAAQIAIGIRRHPSGFDGTRHDSQCRKEPHHRQHGWRRLQFAFLGILPQMSYGTG